MSNLTDPASAAASQASKEEVDSRSVFVGNVSLTVISWQFFGYLDYTFLDKGYELALAIRVCFGSLKCLRVSYASLIFSH